MDQDQIGGIIKHEIAEALGRNEDEVRGEVWLKKDLGAESIDLIDLTFRFEKALGHPLSEQEIFRSKLPDGDLTVAEIVQAVGQAHVSATA